MTHHTPPAYVIRVGYGTLSGSAVVLRAADGAELGSAAARDQAAGRRLHRAHAVHPVGSPA